MDNQPSPRFSRATSALFGVSAGLFALAAVIGLDANSSYQSLMRQGQLEAAGAAAGLGSIFAVGFAGIALILLLAGIHNLVRDRRSQSRRP
jgi:hypothetical protein